MERNKVDVITMGCSKNLVDSERLLGMLAQRGWEVTHDAEQPDGEVCVVNTCGFIGDAKEESINMILAQGQRKAQGELKKLIVMGCLSERYLKELKAEIPEVDAWYGKFDWEGVVEMLGRTLSPLPRDGESLASLDSCAQSASPRILTTPPHYAYIKIAEGCDRHCAYCAIPLITGRHRSRPMEEILDEVRQLTTQGVHEFQVIAQEITYYGLDLYHRRAIAELIDQMADIEGVTWIRLHYAYPTDFPWELAEVMRRRDNVCKYLDIALQHINDTVLNRMHRHFTKADTYALVERLRREVPGIHLRTTLMVGFPGETDEAFDELLDFVKWARFERMGAFAYSEEEGTFSALHYYDDIPDEVKQTRLSLLMRAQQRISAEVQEAKVGTQQLVVIDRREGDYWVGRTQFDSPEVDPEVLIAVADNPDVQVGHFYEVTIVSADDFDLYANISSTTIPSMNNLTFINSLSRRVNMSVQNTQLAANALMAELTDQLTEGNSVTVHGFGAFEVKKRTERVVTMPTTGKRLLVPPKLTVSFKPAQQIKDNMRDTNE